MSEIFKVNESLAIDLLPSADNHGQPALCLYTHSKPEQSIVIFLSEVHLLRDALAIAGGRLAEIEAEVRNKRKTTRASWVCTAKLPA
jgi:hypothetical protein